MTTTEHRIEPVRSQVEVELSPREAFELFTSHISRWWPLETHSVSLEKAETAVFELWEGGEIFELAENSERIVWGTVSVFEPPARVVFTWHPGRDPETAQDVEVTFHSVDGGTRVELVHSNWEALGEKAREMRENYEKGWAYVLGERYEKGSRHLS